MFWFKLLILFKFDVTWFTFYMLQDLYLVSILNDFAGNAFIVFCSTCVETQRLALLLRNLGMLALPLHGKMEQVSYSCVNGRTTTRNKQYY